MSFYRKKGTVIEVLARMTASYVYRLCIKIKRHTEPHGKIRKYDIN